MQYSLLDKVYFLVLQSQSPQLGQYGSVYPLRVRIGPPQEARYGKILGLLSRGGPNTKKYSLVEVIENDCIVTRVGVYNEILPEPSGSSSDSAVGIFFHCVPLLSSQYSYNININIPVAHYTSASCRLPPPGRRCAPGGSQGTGQAHKHWGLQFVEYSTAAVDGWMSETRGWWGKA